MNKLYLLNKSKEHFEDKQEIMAYAYNTTSFYISQNLSKNEALEAVKSDDIIVNKDNNVWNIYDKLFSKTNPKVWNQFRKYVVEYIEKMMN